MKKLFLLAIFVIAPGVYLYTSPVFAFDGVETIYVGPDAKAHSSGSLDWETAHAGSGGGATNPPLIQTIKDGGNVYYIYRGFLSFDLGTLPAGARVTGARLYVKPYQAGGCTSPTVSDNIYISKAFGLGPFNSGFGGPAISNGLDMYSNFVAGTSWVFFDLDPGELLAGETNFLRITTGFDLNNTPGLITNNFCYFKIGSQEYGDPAYLVINYSTGYINVSAGSSTDMLASAGILFTDLWPILAIMAGIPLAFLILNKVQGLILLREKKG